MASVESNRVAVYAGALAMRFAALMAVWAVLTELSAYKLWFGIALAAVTAVTSVALAPPLGRWMSVVAAVRFVPFFLRVAVLGGIDVALRAVRRRPLRPTFIDYPLALESRAGRLWLTCVISLLPGTVACELSEASLHLHVIDQPLNVRPTLEQLERHTAAMFRDRKHA